MPARIPLRRGLKGRVVLIDGVVGKVHESVGKVGSAVGDSGEASQALAVDVHSERVVAGHCYVHSEVEFVPVDEVRIINIPASHHAMSKGNIPRILGQKDAFPLRTATRLEDPNGAWVGLHFVDQF